MNSRHSHDRPSHVISRYFGIVEKQEDTFPYSYRVSVSDSIPEEEFRDLVDALFSSGYIAFTDEVEKDKFYVVERNMPEERELVRFILFFLTIGSVLYAGTVYSGQYFSLASAPLRFAYSAILFFIPIYSIFLAREAARFLAMRRNGMEYSFPIFIPDPIFMGCIGSICVNRSPFRNRKSMVETGAYPLFSGFIVSLALVAIGSVMSFTPSLAIPLKLPFTDWGYPAILLPGIAGVVGKFGVINPVEFAGWSGLIMSGFNAIPMGYLDGGLVWNGLIGRKIQYAHYPLLVVSIIVGLFYPEFIILPVIILLLGLRGPEPLTLTPPEKYYRLIVAGISLLILFGGAVPFHYSQPTNQFTAAMLSPLSIVEVNSSQAVNFDIIVKNTGTSTISPTITLSPSTTQYSVLSQPSLKPGGSGQYIMQFISPKMDAGRTANYSVILSSGIESKTLPISVMSISLNNGYLFGKGSQRDNPLSINGTTSRAEKLSLFADFNGVRNVRLYVIPTELSNYTLTLSNISINASEGTIGSPYFTFNSFQLAGGSVISLSILPTTNPVRLGVFIIDQDYRGAAAYINY